MALKKKPVTGMKDILPAEMAIRDYVIRLRLHAWNILKTCPVSRVEKTRN